jgi:hypothetical protein
LAVTLALVLASTALVCIVNGAPLKPAGTVIVAGTVTFGELLVRLTTAPAAGASPFSVTNPLPSAPPVTLFGEIETSFNDGGCTVSVNDADDEPSVAVTVTGVGAVTWP